MSTEQVLALLGLLVALIALALAAWSARDRSRHGELPPAEPAEQALSDAHDSEPSDDAELEEPQPSVPSIHIVDATPLPLFRSEPRIAPPEPEPDAAPTPPPEPAPVRIEPKARGRHEPPLPEGFTRYPVVLAHGVMGFDQLELSRLRSEYFRGVRRHLERLGAEVYVARVSPLGSIEQRAEQLAEQVRAVPHPRVNIIAHSMGGLDARYAIAKLGLADKVAALVTIGTPHRGTPIADVGTSWLGDRLKLRRVLNTLGADAPAFWDLTTQRMESFNETVPDAPGVVYASCVAAVGRESKRVSRVLAASHWMLHGKHGKNDGLVPADSQRWGEVIAEVEADHWAQIGWAPGFDAGGLYEALVRGLRDRGL